MLLKLAGIVTLFNAVQPEKACPEISVTVEGIEDLRRALYEAALRGASPEEAYLTNERHVQAAKDALAALESAVTALEDRTLDCAALDLRAAWEALGAITGESATEDVIDRIFEKFCLGK